MKIELKNIYFSERMSEETNAFTANLYINGRKVGEASNRGHGGPTEYFGTTKEDRQLIAEAEVYCEQLPEHKFTIGDEEHSYKNSLEDVIDDLLLKYLDQRQEKKAERLMKNAILIGSSVNDCRYLKFNVPLEKILSGQKGKEILARNLKEFAERRLKDGAILLNNNIPEEVIKMAGLVPGQYAAPKDAKLQSLTAQKPPQKQKGKKL